MDTRSPEITHVRQIRSKNRSPEGIFGAVVEAGLKPNCMVALRQPAAIIMEDGKRKIVEIVWPENQGQV